MSTTTPTTTPTTTTTPTPPKGRGFLFGLNYTADATARLSGCINDVQNMALYLQTELAIPCQLFTDEPGSPNAQHTTAMGMLTKLYEIAMLSYREDLDFVWIHYSGHGTSVLDRNSDERDGRDEALVPSDFRTVGVIPDDYVCQLFTYFNPKTRVVCVFDCCHSATIGDVKYSWEGPTNCAIENIMCNVPARIITLSGCLDNQTSADAYNVLGDNKYVGALTACLLMALRENKLLHWTDAFALVAAVRTKLKQRGFPQVPKLCSTHNLALDKTFVPRLPA